MKKPMIYIQNKKIKILYQELMNLLDVFFKKIKYNDREDEYYEKVLLTLFMISFKHLRGIYLLCREGYGPQAMILLRSIIEIGIDIKYMRDEKESRSKLYLGYENIEKYQMYKDVHNKKFFSEEDPEVLEKSARVLRENYDRELEVRGSLDKRNWAGINRYEMAKGTGLEELYDYVYRFVCRYSHNSASSIGETFLGLDEEKATFIRGPHCQTVDAALGMGISSFLEILKITNEDLKIGMSSEVLAYDQNFLNQTGGKRIS